MTVSPVARRIDSAPGPGGPHLSLDFRTDDADDLKVKLTVNRAAGNRM